MSIGMFVDGSFIYKSYPDQIDYLKLRLHLETQLADTIDEAYFFNSDDDPAQCVQQRGRQHHVPILAPFALLNPEGHALAVDGGGREPHGFGDAQARGVTRGQDDTMLVTRHGIEQLADLGPTQHDR
jgi:hypothetical protein